MRKIKAGFLKSKRGSIVDNITVIIFLFILGVVILSMYHVTKSVKDNFDASSSISADSREIMTDYVDNYVTRFDALFGFILVGLTLAAIVSSFFIDTHPVMLPFLIILIAVFIIVSAALANAFYAVESSSAFLAFSEDFVIMHFIMSHLAYYSMILGICIVVALLAKANQ